MKEYEVLINGNTYDVRNDDDRRYLESIGFFDNQQTNGKTIEIMVNEGVWSVPMPTRKDVISDKKFNYELLGEITLISNRKTEFLEDVDISDAEQHRYIYEKGTNSILSNKDFLEEISGCKWDTIKRNLRKLAKCDNDVVSYCKDEKGRYYYKIIPYIMKQRVDAQVYFEDEISSRISL